MKYKTTVKALRDGACNLRSAGYCDLQYLLTNHSPIAYTSGVYGWNFDVYAVYGLTIAPDTVECLENGWKASQKPKKKQWIF